MKLNRISLFFILLILFSFSFSCENTTESISLSPAQARLTLYQNYAYVLNPDYWKEQSLAYKKFGEEYLQSFKSPLEILKSVAQDIVLGDYSDALSFGEEMHYALPSVLASHIDWCLSIAYQQASVVSTLKPWEEMSVISKLLQDGKNSEAATRIQNTIRFLGEWRDKVNIDQASRKDAKATALNLLDSATAFLKGEMELLSANPQMILIPPKSGETSSELVAKLQPNTQPSTPVAPLNVSVGRPAPDFTTSLLTGDSFKLTDQIGKVIILTFWDNTEPNDRILPNLELVWRKYKNEKIVVTAINTQDSLDEVKTIIGKNNITYNIGRDRSKELAQMYQIKATPTTILVDQKGLVKEIWKGPVGQRIISKTISELLGLPQEQAAVPTTTTQSQPVERFPNARLIGNGETITSSVYGREDEVDYYKFEAKPGQNIAIRITESSSLSSVTAEVYTPQNFHKKWYDFEFPIALTASPVTGLYYIVIYGATPAWNNQYKLSLTISGEGVASNAEAEIGLITDAYDYYSDMIEYLQSNNSLSIIQPPCDYVYLSQYHMIILLINGRTNESDAYLRLLDKQTVDALSEYIEEGGSLLFEVQNTYNSTSSDILGLLKRFGMTAGNNQNEEWVNPATIYVRPSPIGNKVDNLIVYATDTLSTSSLASPLGFIYNSVPFVAAFEGSGKLICVVSDVHTTQSKTRYTLGGTPYHAVNGTLRSDVNSGHQTFHAASSPA
jgi:peroxiredoxin